MEYQENPGFTEQKEFPQLIKQRYEVRKQIGEGGFSITYLAFDRHTRKECVLKTLSWKDTPDWKIIELFEREARVLSQMDHSQIPQFIEFFTEKIREETQIILVQEYIEGENLAEKIKEGKHYTEAEAIEIALQVVSILEYLQNFSPAIIHRDIKPSNLLLSKDGELHLIDFGAVRDKILHHQKTEAGGFTVVGTYGFMPFEQFQGQAVPASDIYSLGVTLITLLSHREPHELQMTGSTLEFDSYVNISSSFKSVLKKMIAHNLEDRYATAVELRRDLAAIQAGQLPSSFPKKRKSLSSGTLVALALLLLVSLFVIFKKPTVVPPAPPRSTSRVVDRQPALRPPYTGKVARADVFYDGLPVTDKTKVHPTFWFRNETTGKLVDAQAFFEDGRFTIEGLGPGQYGVSVQFDANELNPQSYPGDLRAFKQFQITENADSAMQVYLLEVIHLIRPENNGIVLRDWTKCCETGKPSHRGPVQFEWKSLGRNVLYDYSVSQIGCPYQNLGSVASGTTRQTLVQLDLPRNNSKEYYIFQLYARKEGRQVGMIMTHGSNGHGWDYRFRVE